MTAVANDVGNAHIFLRQLLCLARKNDVLIGFSTSGNSKSLIKAFAQAKETAVIVAISAVRLVKLRAFLPVVTGCINSVVICAASQDEPPFPMANKCPFCHLSYSLGFSA
jgi:hypothetical protein